VREEEGEGKIRKLGAGEDRRGKVEK